MDDLSPHSLPKNTGWIEVIAGCMFSGKTEELIRRLRRAQIAKQNVKIFKPMIDTRYSEDSIVSHNEQSLPSVLIKDIKEVIELSKGAHVIGIDEAQFFSQDIVEVCNKLANNGKRVIVAGICVVCGNPADKTQRKTYSADRVVVGAADIYEARCRNCHYIPTEN